MSEGKGGRGGDDSDKSKGRKGTTAKDSLISTTARTPAAVLKEGKTPRTPEAQALRDRAIVDAAARQAAMGNAGMLENLQTFIDHSPGKLRYPVNSEEVKGLVSDIRDQMTRSPSAQATAIPGLLDLRDAELAKKLARQETDDLEDDDSLLMEGYQLELAAKDRENADLRAQLQELHMQSLREVFPAGGVPPKVTATKNGKVGPKKVPVSLSPSPPEEAMPWRDRHIADLNQRLADSVAEQSKVNAEVLGALFSLQQQLATGSPLAPPRPTGSEAGAGAHGSAVFRSESAAADSSSSRSYSAKGNNRSVHVSTSSPKSVRRSHPERDDEDDQRSQFSDDTVEADPNVSAEEARAAAIDRITISFGGQHAATSLTADELLSLIHSKHGLELLTIDGGVAVFKGDPSMKTRPCNSRGSPKISELAHEGSLGPTMSRLCCHVFPINPNQMKAGQADHLMCMDNMAMQCLVQRDCDGAMAILNEKKEYYILFEIIGDIFEEVDLTTDSAPTNGRWATIYTIVLLFVITQLQRVSLNRLNPSLLPGHDIYALVPKFRSLWQMRPLRETSIVPDAPRLYMAFTILWLDCFFCGSRTCNKATCSKCQSSSTSYKSSKVLHDKAKSDYVRTLNAKSPALSKPEIIRLKKEWDVQNPAPSETSAAPLESLLEIQHTAQYRRLLKNRYMS